MPTAGGREHQDILTAGMQGVLSSRGEVSAVLRREKRARFDLFVLADVI